MSLSKMKSIEEERDSFDYRVCDDLSEVILQYLPLEDKLRLEGVSKQFQKTVFEGFHEMPIRLFSNWCLKNMDQFLKKHSKVKGINPIEIICIRDETNVEDMRRVINQLIEMIVNNCNNLTKINFNWDWISTEIQRKFVQKCSSKITSLSVTVNSSQKVFNSFPNLQELIVRTDKPDPNLFDGKYKNLKTFGINILGVHTMRKFRKFVDNHKKTLKQLILILPPMPETRQQFVLNQISKLDQLIQLKITFVRGFNNSCLLTEGFNQLAVNCLKLKYISTNLVIDSNETSDMNQLLSPLRQFKELRRLELDIEANERTIKSILKIFKGLQVLEYLTIIISEVSNLMNTNNAILLTDIDIILPNLRYLEIRSAIIAVNKTTAKSLSRLAKLESIKIVVKNKSTADQIRGKLIENCRKIRTIDIGIGEDTDESETESDSETEFLPLLQTFQGLFQAYLHYKNNM